VAVLQDRRADQGVGRIAARVIEQLPAPCQCARSLMRPHMLQMVHAAHRAAPTLANGTGMPASWLYPPVVCFELLNLFADGDNERSSAMRILEHKLATDRLAVPRANGPPLDRVRFSLANACICGAFRCRCIVR
jgi:hypothetical protein